MRPLRLAFSDTHSGPSPVNANNGPDTSLNVKAKLVPDSSESLDSCSSCAKILLEQALVGAEGQGALTIWQ
jgi:hypothetical protein